MSAKKEFNLINCSDDADEKQVLTFYRYELSTNNISEDEIASVGLSLYLTINQDAYEEDEPHYEISLIRPYMKIVNEETKSKTDTIHILSNLTDTKEIRDMASWLNQQADEIDKELEFFGE